MAIRITPPIKRMKAYVKISENAEVSVRPDVRIVLVDHTLVTTPMKARKLPAIRQSEAVIL
jgi:hypothetical protein